MVLPLYHPLAIALSILFYQEDIRLVILGIKMPTTQSLLMNIIEQLNIYSMCYLLTYGVALTGRILTVRHGLQEIWATSEKFIEQWNSLMMTVFIMPFEVVADLLW